MKVPIYQNQVSLPKTRGGGQLSVQANPQAMSAGSRAQAQFGQTLVAGAINWTSDFVKLERAKEQAVETTKIDNLIERAVTENLKKHPSDWTTGKFDKNGDPILYTQFEYRDVIQKSLNGLSKDLLKNISSSAVRTRMAAIHAQRLKAAFVTMNATNRGKYTDYAKGKIIDAYDIDKRRIANLPEGADKEQAIQDASGTVEALTNLRPLIPDTWLKTQRKNFLSDIGEIAISGLMAQLETSDDVGKLIQQLDSPKKSDPYYKDVVRLTPEKKQQFITRLAARRTALQTKEFNQPLREIKKAKVQKQNRRDLTYDGETQKIQKVRAAVVQGFEPGDESWPKDKNNRPLTMPDASEIQQSTTLDKTQKDNLIKEIYGEDTIFNRDEFRVLQGQIYEAVTSQDLDKLHKEIREKRDLNYIGGKAYSELTQDIQNARNKTPEYVERATYRNLLSSAIDRRNAMGTPYDTPQRKQEIKAEAGFASIAGLNFYNNQIDRGVRPAAAFWNTVTKLQKDKFDMVKAEIATMSDVFDPEVIDDVKNNLNPEAIQQARIRLREAVINGGRLKNYSLSKEGELPSQDVLSSMQKVRGKDKLLKAERMTIRRLFADEQKLNFLASYANLTPKQRGIVTAPPETDGDDSTNRPGGNNQGQIMKTLGKGYNLIVPDAAKKYIDELFE